MNNNKKSVRIDNKSMRIDNKSARIVGILFIIGTVAGVSSVPLLSPRTAPDFLAEIAANQNTYTLGAMMVLAMGFSLALVPAFMFPILKRHSEAFGIGYVIFRGATETVTYIIQAVCFLSMAILGTEYVAGGQNAAQLQSMGVLLKEITELPIGKLVFGIGALILYFALYRYELVPRWIPVFGIAGIILHIASGLLVLLGLQENFDTASLIMNLPIAVQEMVMAVWLIIKGFRSIEQPTPADNRQASTA